ncbi:MAG: hypothetical protein ACI4VN_02080 [Clostridia bacterium]|nr:hypothetical protein [Clostridia bacterium]
MTQEERNTLATTPRMYFDTRYGINMMFQEKPETALQEVSHLRRLFEELNPGAKELHEFVVCGEYLLTRHGETHHIDDPIPNKDECMKHGSCIIVEDFLNITGISSYNASPVEF